MASSEHGITFPEGIPDWDNFVRGTDATFMKAVSMKLCFVE